MSDYVISLDKAAAADADSVGPKAANLAALAQPACRRRDAFVSTPMPIGDDRVRDADPATQRRLSVRIRLRSCAPRVGLKRTAWQLEANCFEAEAPAADQLDRTSLIFSLQADATYGEGSFGSTSIRIRSGWQKPVAKGKEKAHSGLPAPLGLSDKSNSLADQQDFGAGGA